MDNSIEKAYQDIRAWKERTASLFTPEVLNSRTFKLEELGMYEKLLQRGRRGLSESEAIFRNLVKEQRNSMIKQLYPNPVVRLAWRLLDFAFSVLRNMVRKLSPDRVYVKRRQLLNDLNRFGFSSSTKQIVAMLDKGHQNFKVQYNVSLDANEILRYILNIRAENGSACLHGYQLQSVKDNQVVSSLSVDQSMMVSREQASQLIRGRSVQMDNTTWRTVDLNDRDAEGQLQLRDVDVPDFNIEAELGLLPLAAKDKLNIQDHARNLKEGKQIEVSVAINENLLQLQAEALPLQRKIQLMANGKVFSPETKKIFKKIQYKQGENIRKQINRPHFGN
ncbi:hypothetical protein [uncultured Pedobacter sp.]|uniref:hypothetical protein n=1 Tax=uncultured Pedobacter sp. TaxID=246139 RepID=UPI002630C764|nr:hypothetical protein [uncultured Pedobacter sp.]